MAAEGPPVGEGSVKRSIFPLVCGRYGLVFLALMPKASQVSRQGWDVYADPASDIPPRCRSRPVRYVSSIADARVSGPGLAGFSWAAMQDGRTCPAYQPGPSPRTGWPTLSRSARTR